MPTTVGSTAVKVMPDTTSFGPQLQLELGRLTPVVKIGLQLAPSEPIKVKLDALAGVRTVRIDAKLTGDAAVSARLDRLTANRTAKITTVLVGDAALRAQLDGIAGDRTLKIKVQLDTASMTRLRGEVSGLTGTTLKVGVELDQASVARFQNQLALAVKNRLVVKVVPELDVAATVSVRTALTNLAQNRSVVIDVSDRGTATASAAIDRAARDRRSTISVGVNSGSSDRSLGGLLGSLGNLKALAVTSVPALASIGQAIVAMAPAAALAAPAIAGLGSAIAAIKIGTAGIGDALKAAFSNSTADANRAASAAKAVESAQKSLATAVRGVATAEKDLATAQTQALAAQKALTAAREQGRRELQDMNNNLKDAQLSQRQAVLDAQSAAKQLAADKAKGSKATADQIAADQLASDQANQHLAEQQQQVQRLTADTEAANKKGLAGTQAMTAAQQQVASSGQTVVDKQAALVVAQQQVASAADAVADAQKSAASQTSALSLAMAKLSPNARAFVNTIVSLGPAWRNLQLGVQDKLFAGIGTRIQGLARTVLPTLRMGLVGMAGDLNMAGKNALSAVGNLQKTGMLRQIFAGAAEGLKPLVRIPGQVVTAFGQLTIAAQPQFNKLTKGIGSVVDQIAKKLTGMFKSGELQTDIKVAVDLFKQLFVLVSNVFTIVKNVLAAAASAGGDVLGVLGQTLAQIAKISAMPAVQAALKSIFGALAAVAKLISGAVGTAIQALLPVLASLAPMVTALANALMPVVKQLLGSAGALLPIIGGLVFAFNPLLGIALMLAPVMGKLTAALTPVLLVIVKLAQALLTALQPVFNVIIRVVGQLLTALSGPVTTIIAALIPVVTMLGGLISSLITALMPALKPLLAIVIAVANVFANVFAAAIKALLPALQPLIPLIVMVVTLLANLLSAVLTPLAPVLTLIGTVFSTILGMALKIIAPILAMIVHAFMQLLPAFQPLIPLIGLLATAVLSLLTPLLSLLTTALKPILSVVGFVAGILVKVLGAALNFLIPIVVTVIEWIVKFELMVVKVVLSVLKWFAHLFDELLGHSIIPDIVNGIVSWFTGLWHTVESIFNAIASVVSTIWNALWDGIKSVASAAWGLVKTGFNAFATVFSTAFGLLRDGIGLIWGGVKALFSAPIKFLVQTVYDQGIRTVWNATAGKIGLGDLPAVTLPKGFATGGIMPGYTPGRDVHLVPSVSGPVALSGGEAIMRPEWTRAVGPDYVHTMNAVARTGGVQAIRDTLGLQGFDGGGIFGEVTHVISQGVDWARQGIADLAEAAFKPVRAILDSTLGGSPPGSWGDSARLMPETTITKAIAFIRGQEATSVGGAGLSALHVAEQFKGVDYLWGGTSPSGFDCSGLMQYAYQHGPHLGIPRTSEAQQAYTMPVSLASAQAGDLVYFGSPAHHVGMFVKPGTMIDAPHTGAKVREEGLGSFTNIGRVPGIAALLGQGVAGLVGTTVAQSHAQALLPAYGWGAGQFAPLQQLWNRESGWNYKATNPSSGAYGIPQALPASKMAAAGADWMTNPFTQEKWGLDYIKGRYVNPANAWAHELQFGWYADGGFPSMGELAMVGERGPELVRFGGAAQVYPSDVTARMAHQMAGVVAGTAAAPRTVGKASTVNNSTARTLEYHATTREVASRQSILDALAHEELLHRTVQIGG